MTPDFFRDILWWWWWWLSCSADKCTSCLEEDHLLPAFCCVFFPRYTCFLLRLVSCSEGILVAAAREQQRANPAGGMLMQLLWCGAEHLPAGGCAALLCGKRQMSHLLDCIFSRFLIGRVTNVHFWESYCNTSLWFLFSGRKSRFLTLFFNLENSFTNCDSQEEGKVPRHNRLTQKKWNLGRHYGEPSPTEVSGVRGTVIFTFGFTCSFTCSQTLRSCSTA